MNKIKVKEWVAVKMELDNMSFPEEDRHFDQMNIGETHYSKSTKQVHSLISYKKFIKTIRDKYLVYGHYNHCGQCNSIRNKYLVVYNEEENLCHVKNFVKHEVTIF